MAVSVLDLLFPPQCVGCKQTRGAWLCASCRAEIARHRLPMPCPHGVAATFCARGTRGGELSAAAENGGVGAEIQWQAPVRARAGWFAGPGVAAGTIDEG